MVEDTLIDDHMKNMRIARDKKVAKCHGILRLIEPCSHVLEVNFPLQRDNGTYEMITGYRAQHSHHRSPCKGGIRSVPVFSSVLPELSSDKCAGTPLMCLKMK